MQILPSTDLLGGLFFALKIKRCVTKWGADAGVPALTLLGTPARAFLTHPVDLGGI